MASIDDLFVSLLEKNDIHDFLPVLIEGMDSDYWGYVKGGIFYLCNKHFETIERKSVCEYYGNIQVGKSNSYYSIPFNGEKYSLIIDQKGQIIVDNPETYYPIDSRTFLITDPIFMDEYSVGIVYDVLMNKFYEPNDLEGEFNVPRYTVDEESDNPNYLQYSCNERNGIKLTSHPYENGKYLEDYTYLFSYRSNQEEDVAFFLYECDKKKYILKKSEGRYYEIFSESYRYDIKWIWFSVSGAFLITYDIVKAEDGCHEDSVFYSIGEYHQDRKFIKRCDRIPFNIKFTPDCFMLYKGDEYGVKAVVTINDTGKFMLTEDAWDSGYNCQDLHNNMIIWKKKDAPQEFKYLDSCGYPLNRQRNGVFERILPVLTRFNPLERAALLEDRDFSFRYRHIDDLYFDVYKGVMDEDDSGKVMVPPCFSSIESDTFPEPFVIKEISTPTRYKRISVVCIKNYYNGIKRSYYGMYANDEIKLPIGYDAIDVIKNNSRDTSSEYVRILKDNKYGLSTTWGDIICQVDVDYVDALFDSQGDKTDYAYLLNTNQYALVYKGKMLTDFSLKQIDSDTVYTSKRLFFVKLYSEIGCSIYYNGKLITNEYMNVTPFQNSSYELSSENDLKDIVLKVSNKEGLFGLINSEGTVIFPCMYNNIEVYKNTIVVDGIVYGSDGNELVNTTSFELLDKYKNPYCLLKCFKNLGKYFFIEYFNGQVIVLKEDELPYEDSIANLFYPPVSVDFDFTYNKFYEEYVGNDEVDTVSNDDTYNSYCYEDDIRQMEKDTYYALGGEDFDEYISNGEDVDDMMDEIEY